jgi:ubiquinone/menaquinone biosynthesis C-methylase UbiE
METLENDDHFSRVYRHQAAEYQQLVAAEDVYGNLPALLQSLLSPAGKRVLDAGAGTGRFAQLLDGLAGEVVGLDRELAMLAENQQVRAARRGSWQLVQADLGSLPFSDGEFEISLCGWAIGHWCFWAASNWEQRVDHLLGELRRVTAPGGWLVVFETMGTGVHHPAPPNQALARYYLRLEETWGFNRQVVATDYRFDSVPAAVESLGFFFGQELAEKIQRHQWRQVPEWTGVWSQQRG